ncbi:MFS transporter [Metabacillus sp. GX 13764]|uniref:MFS transporter n=1 Tax=Metabacillus kandeliae TaxID=2900151 RepID=UPI001E548EB6|nr:MFS transporter [Metabacillus kandeliae]
MKDLDSAPLNKFHFKITALTFGANFSDGYSLGAIGTALALIGPQMNLGSSWMGLLGSSALIGIFLGSILLGRLGDAIGRQKLYLYDFLLLAIASALQFFVQGPVELFILRLIIGFCIGADYAIGPALVSEFVPKKHRGSLLGTLTVMWTVGYVAAYFAGTLLAQAGPDSWRWLLASSTLPAILVLILRIGTPESPRWLMSKGRIEEAKAIIHKYIGANVSIHEVKKESRTLGFMDLFRKKYAVRTAFAALFYICNVLPYFAIYTFLPLILEQMKIKDEFLGNVLLNGFLLLGGIAGLWFLHKMTRRKFTIGSFVILAASLSLLGIWPNGPFLYMMPFFLLFTFVMSGFSNITQVYPAELFPTEIRGSGIGLANGLSRIGAAIGTFFLPVSMESIGLGPSMLWLAGVLLIGAVVSIAWAPETGDVSLDDAAKDAEGKRLGHGSPQEG